MTAGRTARLRSLTPGQAARLDGLRRVAQLLDSAFVVPGTTYRVGLDPVLGLIPGLGDLVSPLFTIGILWQANELGVPRVVQLRMLFNVAIDSFVGAVPVLGDLFDFAWKANAKNMALLERHAELDTRASASDWVFVLALIAMVVVLAALPIAIAAWAIAALGRQIL